MTKISYIHGLPEDEVVDRAKSVPSASKIPFGGMTEGELRLRLLREQLSILGSYYPEGKEYKKAKTEIDNALYAGVHGLAHLSGATTDITRYNIATARQMNYPAIRSGYGLGQIETEDCSQHGRFKQNMWGKLRFVGDLDAYLACQNKNDFVEIFNNHLEKSSHHLLYNYVVDANNSPQTVASKTLLHRLAVDKLASVSGLSKSNVQMWMRNGIMRHNALQGTQPYSPEDSIEILGKGFGVGVGEPVTAAIIIKAVVAAIGAITALVASMKPTPQEEFRSTLTNIGLESFGPEQQDWENYTQNSTSDNNYLPWVLGAGALLLLNN